MKKNYLIIFIFINIQLILNAYSVHDKYLLPRIIQHPQSQVAQTGNKITFKCDYDIIDTLTLTSSLGASSFVEIKWLFNFNYIEQLFNTNDYITDKNRLILLAYDPTRHNGEYRCLINNTLISWAILSEPANLSLAYIDQIDTSTDPQDNTVLSISEGNVAIIQCKLPASNPPAIPVFVLNNTILIDNDIPRYKIFPSGNLQISNVRPSDSGVYTCSARNTITNEIRNNTKRTGLRVTEPSGAQAPEIVYAPVDANRVQIGSNLTLECVASGAPVPNVSWEKFGGSLPDKRAVQLFGNLLLTRIQQEDRGTYVCRAGNGQATFRTAMVDVFEAPTLLNLNDGTANSLSGQIVKYYANRNENIELKCPIRSRPKADVQWFFNGRLITSSQRSYVITERSLLIKSVNLLSIGAYQCYARNDYGFKQAQIVLYLKDDPFLVQSHDVQAISTTTTSPSPPTASQLANVHNTYGQKPQILIGPQNVSLFEGQTIVLLCVTDANAQINWLKNDIIIEPSLMRRFEINQVGNLRIVSAQKSDTGLYKCIASNEFGMSSAEGYVTVKDEETSQRTGKGDESTDQAKKTSKKVQYPIPAKPTIEQIDKDKILLKWTLIMPETQQQVNDNDNLLLTLDYFKIEYRIMSTTTAAAASKQQFKVNQWTTIDEQIDVKKREYILTDLSPADYYRFRINAYLKNGYQTYGQQSIKFKLDELDSSATSTTQMAALLGATANQTQLNKVQIQQIWSVSESSLAIKWQLNGGVNGTIDGFYIYYRKMSQKADKNTYQIITIPNSQIHAVDTYVLTQLDSASSYEIKMTCFNANKIKCETSNTIFGVTLAKAVGDPQGSAESVPSQSTKQNEILFMVLGVVLGILTLLLVLFIILCVIRQRQHKSLLVKLNTSNKLTGSSCPTLIYDDCVRNMMSGGGAGTAHKMPFFSNDLMTATTNGTTASGGQNFLILQQNSDTTLKPPIPNVPPPQLNTGNRQMSININPLGYLDANNIAALNYIKQHQHQQQQQQQENFYHTLNTVNQDYNQATLNNLQRHFYVTQTPDAFMNSLQRVVGQMSSSEDQNRNDTNKMKRSFKRSSSKRKKTTSDNETIYQQQQQQQQLHQQTAILIPAHLAQNFQIASDSSNYQTNKFLLNSNFLLHNRFINTNEQTNNLLAANSNSNSSGIGSTSTTECNEDVLHEEELLPFLPQRQSQQCQDQEQQQQSPSSGLDINIENFNVNNIDDNCLGNSNKIEIEA